MEALNEIYPIYRIGLTFAAFFVFLILRYAFTRSVFNRANDQNFDSMRIQFIKRVVRSFINVIFTISLGIIWEVSFKGLSLYIASFLTIIGVGLFATWSMVSNITASVILFFFFPFKIGSRVKIIDGDNSVQGTVYGLSVFSIKLKLDDDTEIYYPNNLAIQKGILHMTNNN